MEQPSSSTSDDLSVHVVAHVSRKARAEALAASVSADHVWMDEGYHGEWKNHKRAWQGAMSSGKKYGVVLQDDAVPIDDFRKHVTAAVTHRPDELISLYVGTHRPRKLQVIHAVYLAESQSASWLMANTLMWGVGVVMPTARIQEMLDKTAKIRLPYDQRLGAWAETTGRSVYYTWPSLVDHADEETVAHAGKKQGVRVAHKVGVPNWKDITVNIALNSSPHGVASKRDIV